MLSARAIGVLVFIATREANISAESLQTYFKEGRDAIASALRELRIEQLIQTKRGKAGNHFYTQTLVTDQGKEYLKTHLRIQVMDKVISVPVIEYVNTQVQVKHGAKKLNSGLNSGLDPNSAEYRKKTLEIYEDQQLKKHKTRIINRREKAKVDWTPSDSGYEFEDRIMNIWEIPPWRVNESRFIPALASARRKHGTDGEIECQMMDLFLIDDGWLKHQTGDHLWQAFIRQFPALAKTAKLMQPKEFSKEELEQIRKSWEGL
jgi:hypothetical protein